MRLSTNNPMAVVVKAEIDIHTAINAIEEFAEKYPAERLSIDHVRRLDKISQAIYVRLYAEKLNEE